MTSKHLVSESIHDFIVFKETKYKVLLYSKSNDLLYQEWTNESLKMDFETFKQEAQYLIDAIKHYNPKKFLTNLEDFHYRLSEVNNAWYMENLIPVIQESAIEKTAIVVNEDLLNQVQMENLEQDVEREMGGISSNYIYFDQLKKAFDWLNHT